MNKSWVIIPAAGVGQRMQSDIPKQYLKLQGLTVIEHTLQCFAHHPEIAGIIIALHPDDPYWPELEVKTSVPVHAVDGGLERADSVFNALSFLIDQTDDLSNYVLVHDAARPCLSTTDLNVLLAQRTVKKSPGALLAMPVRDTMKREHNGFVDHTVDREGLWHALTPQMFQMRPLYDALLAARQNSKAITDEASAMELVGIHPALVEGDASNIKITRPADLKLAEFFLQQKKELTH